VKDGSESQCTRSQRNNSSADKEVRMISSVLAIAGTVLIATARILDILSKK
jgi:hypothetical protein